MGGNLKVWVLKFRGKIFGGNTTVYISSGETNTVYPLELSYFTILLDVQIPINIGIFSATPTPMGRVISKKAQSST